MDEEVLKKLQEAIKEHLDARLRELAAGNSPDELWRLKCELAGARSFATFVLNQLKQCDIL